jgi:hypothetical protein
MKFGELQDEITRRMDDDQGAIATSGQVGRWVNQAIRSLARIGSWPFLRTSATISTVATTRSITLPEGVARPLTLQHQSGTKEFLFYRSFRWVNLNYPDETIGFSSPEYWTEGGIIQSAATAKAQRRILVVPTPNAAYNLTFTYVATPTDLTNDEHYPLLPDDFDEAIVLWVLRLYYRKLEDEAFARIHDANLREEVANLLLTYGLSQHYSYGHISDYSGDI